MEESRAQRHFVLDKETLITIGMLRPSTRFNPWWNTGAKQFKAKHSINKCMVQSVEVMFAG